MPQAARPSSAPIGPVPRARDRQGIGEIQIGRAAAGIVGRSRIRIDGFAQGFPGAADFAMYLLSPQGQAGLKAFDFIPVTLPAAP
jgi:hypothetical protein